jgi:hypothetical protein
MFAKCHAWRAAVSAGGYPGLKELSCESLGRANRDFNNKLTSTIYNIYQIIAQRLDTYIHNWLNAAARSV